VDSIDFTKLLGGGGVGIVLLVAMGYFLRHIERRDARDEERSKGFLEVTKGAVEAIGRVDARAGIVVDAVKGLKAQVARIDERTARIEDKLDRPPEDKGA
jgi:hypothetical protein